MLRLLIILVSVLAFSKVAVAATGSDASKKGTTEVTKSTTTTEVTTDASADEEGNKADDKDTNKAK